MLNQKHPRDWSKRPKTRDESLPIILNQAGFFQCPCGFEYTHLESVVLLRDKEDRGQSVGLDFNCENGCKCRLKFEQHEDNTIVTLAKLLAKPRPWIPPVLNQDEL